MHPVVSAVLIMAFSIAIVGMVVSFGMPLLESRKQSLDFEAGKNAVNALSAYIIDLSDDPVSSSKYAEVDFGAGIIEFSEDSISYNQEHKNYNRTFDSLSFNKIRVYPGRSRVKITKMSPHELHVSLE